MLGRYCTILLALTLVLAACEDKKAKCLAADKECNRACYATSDDPQQECYDACHKKLVACLTE